MTQDTGKWGGKPWLIICGGVLGLLLLVGAMGPCHRQAPPTPDEQLVKMADHAVEMAERAQKENDAAYLWPSRVRLLVIVVGVGLPMGMVVVLAWILTRHQPDDAEILAEAWRQVGLLGKPASKTPPRVLEAQNAPTAPLARRPEGE